MDRSDFLQSINVLILFITAGDDEDEDDEGEDEDEGEKKGKKKVSKIISFPSLYDSIEGQEVGRVKKTRFECFRQIRRGRSEVD